MVSVTGKRGARAPSGSAHDAGPGSPGATTPALPGPHPPRALPTPPPAPDLGLRFGARGGWPRETQPRGNERVHFRRHAVHLVGEARTGMAGGPGATRRLGKGQPLTAGPDFVPFSRRSPSAVRGRRGPPARAGFSPRRRPGRGAGPGPSGAGDGGRVRRSGWQGGRHRARPRVALGLCVSAACLLWPLHFAQPSGAGRPHTRPALRRRPAQSERCVSCAASVPKSSPASVPFSRLAFGARTALGHAEAGAAPGGGGGASGTVPRCPFSLFWFPPAGQRPLPGGEPGRGAPSSLCS